MKIGKTSFAAQIEKNLLLCSEIGTNALDDLKAVPVMKWKDVKDVLRQLRDPKARELYNTITFDTITLFIPMIEKFVCAREGVGNIREILYGQGWNMVAQELQETLREITMLGFGLILIAHSKDKATSKLDNEGNPIMSVTPDIGNKKISQVCSAVTDLIAYIGIDFDKEGNPTRYLYTRQTPTVFAGSRWRYLAPIVPFGYHELVDAISDAIERQKTLDGATVVEHQERKQMVARPFADIMKEARELWENYFNAVSTDEEKEQRFVLVKDILRKVFGNEDFKLSTAVPSQADLVELFIDEMKDIM